MAKESKAAPGFKRLPGKANQYIDLETGEILSRRQYDKRYGKLAKEGFTSYEQKAKANKQKDELKQLERPARKRTSILKVEPELRKEIAQKRQEQRELTRIQKAINRANHKKVRVPQKVSISNFKPGKMGRQFRMPLDPATIRDFIETSRKYSGAAGYLFGVEFLDIRSGQTGAASLTGLRDFSVPFDAGDWEDIENWFEEHSYAEPLFAFVYIALKPAVYEKRKK